MNDLKELITECRNSCFAMHNYHVNIELKRFVDSMLLHTWDEMLSFEQPNLGKCKRTIDKKFNLEWLERITPEFQRKNNKWNKQMKLKFIENLLKGAKTELLFFRFKELDDAQIIDGLQRTTAILDFFHGKVKPFGKDISELKEYLNHFHTNLTIKIYTFDEWYEVGKFYIDMNENITHSKADIQKCKDWFLKDKGISL